MDVFFEQYKPASSIANYLTLGSKTNGEQTLGFELEHFVVEKGSLAAVPFSAAAAPVGRVAAGASVENVLEALKPYYNETVYEEDDEGNSHLFGLGREKAVITLEPGAQLELSIGPAHSVREIEQLYRAFREEIDPVLDARGLRLLELGYHPTRQARELSLLPKRRYQYMDKYFSHTGSHGICMMRATASTQVSVDYTSESDAMTKLRIANALGPLFAFITDNSPVFEGEKVGLLGGTTEVAQSGLAVPRRMARMVCWSDTDPNRTQIPRGGFDEDFSFLRYAENLVDAPGIFLPAWATGTASPEYLGFTTFKQRLADAFLDEDTILHILSLFFYDARFKTYLEIRQADSMPLDYALAYAALIRGIFYNPEAQSYFSKQFKYIDSASVAFALSALRVRGFDAEVYGRSASEWLDEMVACAREGLDEEDAGYLVPLAELVAERRTLLEALHPLHLEEGREDHAAI
ncbi:MAG: hypothetical protein LBJ48_07950 [Coriobacteriales bacterium]|jgi:glutamate--cysteine ligase|nr:hypothetical protein [Coriobacteriales bacterium]